MNQTIAEYANLDDILAEIRNGDTEALAQLYHRTATSVYAFALSILKNSHDAEDVLHDCYVNVFTSADSYSSLGKPMAWIMTITRNLCLKKLQERKRTADLDQEDWNRFSSGDSTQANNDRILVRECMLTLNDEERQIVVLHAVAGMKHRQIGALLGIPLSTVLSKYNRAIKKLRANL